MRDGMIEAASKHSTRYIYVLDETSGGGISHIHKDHIPSIEVLDTHHQVSDGGPDHFVAQKVACSSSKCVMRIDFLSQKADQNNTTQKAQVMY